MTKRSRLIIESILLYISIFALEYIKKPNLVTYVFIIPSDAATLSVYIYISSFLAAVVCLYYKNPSNTAGRRKAEGKKVKEGRRNRIKVRKGEARMCTNEK